MATNLRPLVGLVPAAGRATRLGELPCSKEVLRLGGTSEIGVPGSGRPACACLLGSFAKAGITNVLFLLRQGKWDIPATLGDGSGFGVNLAYMAFEATANVPETLDKAYPFVAESIVALGFPDIIFEPTHAYQDLLQRHRTSSADVVLGLFPTDQSWKADMVAVDENDRIREIVIKQAETDLKHTWSIAVWGPTFTRFLHEEVEARRSAPDIGPSELYIGDVIRAAITAGLDVLGVRFDRGSFLDIGTPRDLALACSKLTDR